MLLSGPMSRRGRVLAVLLAVLAPVTVWVLLQDPYLSVRVRGALFPSDTTFSANLTDAEGRDVPLGTPIPETAATAALRRTPGTAKRGCLVVACGECVTCMKFDFRAWQQQARAVGVPFVALAAGDAEQVRRFSKDLPVRIPVVRDPGTETMTRLNAFWAGRVYYFDDQWRLRWRSKLDGDPADRVNLAHFGQFAEDRPR